MNRKLTVTGESNGLFWCCINTTAYAKREVDEISNYFNEAVCEFYLDHTYTDIVDDSTFEAEPVTQSEYADAVAKKIKNTPERTLLRVQSENYSATGAILGSSHGNCLLFFYTDEKKHYTSMCLFQPYKDGSFDLYAPLIVYYTSKRRKIVEDIAKSNTMYMVCKELPTPMLSALIALTNVDTGRETIVPTYGKEEIRMIQNAIKHNSIDMFIRSILDAGVIYAEDADTLSIGRERYGRLKEMFSDSVHLKFSSKEYRFVAKYCEKINVASDIDPFKESDLSQYLSNLRYGNEMLIRFPNFKEDIELLGIVEVRGDKLFVHLLEKISNNTFIEFDCNFGDIHKFSIRKSIKMENISIILTDASYIPMDLKDINNKSALVQLGLAFDTTLCITFLQDLIVIHDRPKRSRVVRTTRQISHQLSSKKKEGKDYVVSRVLMPVNEAKALVAAHASTSERAEAQYVLEDWERIGYSRTYKSGKVVWVRPTTCHRHLPLTEKEVIVKL